MFKIETPIPPHDGDAWERIAWPMTVAKYQQRLAQRAATVHSLKQWTIFIGSVIGLLMIASWLDHLNGRDNGNTGEIFLFLSTIICGIGWLFYYGTAKELRGKLDEREEANQTSSETWQRRSNP